MGGDFGVVLQGWYELWEKKFEGVMVRCAHFLNHIRHMRTHKVGSLRSIEPHKDTQGFANSGWVQIK